MRKLCAAITVVGATVLSSLVQAEGITGIYSCSSGVNNDRPVTYVFNTDLMVRNNADATPFEFLSALNNGMLLYIGRLKTDSYDSFMEITGSSKEALPKWARFELTRMESRWHKPNFDVAEYVQLRALACSLGVESFTDINPGLFGVPDSVKPYANNCQKSLEAVAYAGIDDIEEFFIAKNVEKLREEASAEGYNSDRLLFDVVIVAVDLSSAQIYEAKITQPEKNREYNCTVLDIDVPKIDPPENAIKAST